MDELIQILPAASLLTQLSVIPLCFSQIDAALRLHFMRGACSPATDNGNEMFKILKNLFARAPSPEVIKAREDLYTQYWGATPEINHSTNRVFPHIDVYHFSPTPARPFHTLITGGMAEYQQPVDEELAPRRLELMIQILAEYPAQNATFFAPYHTIPMGYRLTDTSEISAFMLAPPENEDLDKLSIAVDGEPVHYLLAIPITMTEHAYAREVSTDDLYQRLKQANLLVHADDGRQSVLDYTPKEIE
jgi:hypothetical protein